MGDAHVARTGDAMKATVNFEFSSEELEGLASRVLSGAILGAFGNADPAQLQAMLAVVHQGVGIGVNLASHAMGQRPPPWMRSQGPMPPGPYGASPPVPPGGYPYPTTGPVGGPSNVRPIREPMTVDRCFPIEGTRNIEPGWGCCECATYNGLQRAQCRNCGHARCGGATVTPAPAQPPPPQMPEDQRNRIDRLVDPSPPPEPPEGHVP